MNLKELGPREKERLIQLIAESQRRKDSLGGIYNYNPLPECSRFHESTAQFRLLLGGNRSSKTLSGCMEDAYWFLGRHPHRSIPRSPRMEIVSLSYETIGSILYPKLFQEGAYFWYEATCYSCGKELPKNPIPVDCTLLSFPAKDGVLVCSCGHIHSIGDMDDFKVAAPPLIPSKLIKDIAWESKNKNWIKFVKGKTGATLLFRTSEQGGEKFQGTAPHAVHIDEELGKDAERIASEIFRGLIDTRGSLWWSATPLAKQMPLLELQEESRLEESGVDSFSLCLTDNYCIPIDSREIIASKWPKDEIQSRIFGKFLIYEGLVYKDFNPSVHVVDAYDIPDDWPIVMSMDPGLTNPNATLWFAVDPYDNVVVIQEHSTKGKSIDFIAQEVKRVEKYILRRTPVKRLIDPSSKNSITSTKGIKAEFARRGLRFTNAKRSIPDGIAVCQLRLRLNEKREPKFLVFRTCRHFLKEMALYRWPDSTSIRDAKEVPLKKNDHFMDAWRYFELNKPSYQKYINPDPDDDLPYVYEQWRQESRKNSPDYIRMG